VESAQHFFLQRGGTRSSFMMLTWRSQLYSHLHCCSTVSLW